MNYIKSRIQNDSGDSNTISMLLWIVLVVMIVIGVGPKIYTAVTGKGDQVADCINKSNGIFTGTSTADCIKTTP